MPSLSSLATFFYEGTVTDRKNQDISGDPVSYAFIPRLFPTVHPDPADPDWRAATNTGGNTWAVIGGTPLTKGGYDVWRKLVDGGQTYVKRVDYLEVT